MFNLQNCKFSLVTAPVNTIASAVATTIIDTKGFRAVTFLMLLGVTDAAVSVFKVLESNDPAMAGANDVPGADFSVLPATLPTATNDGNMFAIYLNLQGRKRYLDLSLTIGAGAGGAQTAVVAILDRAEETPVGAVERGVLQHLIA
jgi:hypothetical protein